MHTHQRSRQNGTWRLRGHDNGIPAELVLVFSSSRILMDASTWHELRSFYPNARIVACSTAGEIEDVRVMDDSIVCTAMTFDSSRFIIATALLDEMPDSEALGRLLAERLPPQELVHALVLSDGLRVNGTRLLRGLSSRFAAGYRRDRRALGRRRQI